MTLEELSRVSQAMAIQSYLFCYFYRQAGEERALLPLLYRYWLARGANIVTDWRIDDREG